MRKNKLWWNTNHVEEEIVIQTQLCSETNCNEEEIVMKINFVQTQIVMKQAWWWNRNCAETQMHKKSEIGKNTKCDQKQNCEKNLIETKT